jgi:glycosyltransferase involved in cell wall biosynthesis
VIAQFLLPCGVPIATRGLVGRRTDLEVVVHGSDARLFDALPVGQHFIGTELRRSGARLRFVSSELERLVWGGLSVAQRQHLQPLSRIEPCAIDVAPQTRSSARQELGLAESARLAVIVARLVPGKRVDVALEACSRIPHLKTIIVGDGPERAALMARFPLAQFVGHVPRSQALTYVAAANVLVSASLHEGAPTVVREARALGTPVVCLAAGDLAHWAQTDPDLHVIT